MSPLIELQGIVKAYAALRPLRIQSLAAGRADCLVLRGFDEGAAEMFIHLVTGASLPDEGTVRIGGLPTSEIATDTEWLSSLDRFGIVTHRAVLIDKLSTASNLALPLTVSIDPVPADVLVRVGALARDVGLEGAALERQVGTLSEEERVRLHLARAVANGPELVLLEHPTARLAGDRDASERFGRTLADLTRARNVGWIALTEDEAFAAAAGGTVLELNPTTGQVAAPGRGWRRWL